MDRVSTTSGPHTLPKSQLILSIKSWLKKANLDKNDFQPSLRDYALLTSGATRLCAVMGDSQQSIATAAEA